MAYNVTITPRDLEYFDDLSRFGFTTIEHFLLRFGASYGVSKRRVGLLLRGKYLEVLGRLSAGKREIYVPGTRFFDVVPSDKSVRLNPFHLKHDEYILVLFSLIRNKFKYSKIFLEQDLIKKGKGAKILRVPDMIVHERRESFIIEYERTLKSKEQYERMNAGLKQIKDKKYRFVFLCEHANIAYHIQKYMDLKPIYILSAHKFLDYFKANTFDSLLDCVSYSLLEYITIIDFYRSFGDEK